MKDQLASLIHITPDAAAAAAAGADAGDRDLTCSGRRCGCDIAPPLNL